MPQPSTLVYVANLVIARVLADGRDTSNVSDALEEAYPFDESVGSRRIWYQALVRYGLDQKSFANKRIDAA